MSLFWLLLLDTQSHQNYLYMMLKKDLFPQLQGTIKLHKAPPGYFILLSFAMLWPMSLHVTNTVRYAYRSYKKPLVYFLLAWIVPTWLFFEIMPTKLRQHILPTYPAIAILTALSIIYFEKNKIKNNLVSKIYYVIWGIVTIGLGIVISIGSYYYFRILSITTIATSIILIVGSCIGLHYQLKEKFINATITLSIMAILVYGLLLQSVIPNIKSIWLTEHITSAIHELEKADKIEKNSPIISSSYYNPSLVFRLGTNRVFYTSSNNISEKIQHITSKEIILLISQSDYEKLSLPSSMQKFFLKTISGINYNKKKKHINTKSSIDIVRILK